jgi:hypothetical protein
MCGVLGGCRCALLFSDIVMTHDAGARGRVDLVAAVIALACRSGPGPELPRAWHACIHLGRPPGPLNRAPQAAHLPLSTYFNSQPIRLRTAPAPSACSRAATTYCARRRHYCTSPAEGLTPIRRGGQHHPPSPASLTRSAHPTAAAVSHIGCPRVNALTHSPLSPRRPPAVSRRACVAQQFAPYYANQVRGRGPDARRPRPLSPPPAPARCPRRWAAAWGGAGGPELADCPF